MTIVLLETNFVFLRIGVVCACAILMSLVIKLGWSLISQSGNDITSSACSELIVHKSNNLFKRRGIWF